MSINLRGCYLMPQGTESQGVCISYKRAEDSIVTEAIAWALREIRSHCISDSRILFIVSGKRTTNKHDQCLLIRMFSTMEVPWIWLTVSLVRWMRMGLTVNMGGVTKFVLVRTRKVLSRYPDLPQRQYYYLQQSTVVRKHFICEVNIYVRYVCTVRTFLKALVTTSSLTCKSIPAHPSKPQPPRWRAP